MMLIGEVLATRASGPGFDPIDFCLSISFIFTPKHQAHQDVPSNPC